MNVKLRRYKLLSDFERVCNFFTDNYKLPYSHLTQANFEYNHTHPSFNHKLTHRFEIWEDGDEIVAFVCYESNLGECFLSAKAGYEYLKDEIIQYAEKELSKAYEGKRCLEIFSMGDQDFEDLLARSAYKLVFTEPITVFPYEKGFAQTKLPPGFSLISLEDENDIKKIDDCLYKGFDHGNEVRSDLDCRMLMQSGPHFRKDLTTIIKAPNGEYACFAGMWVDSKNKFAYLEPLATVPAYRRMGLATVALMEGMRKTVACGAKYCYGGSREFYHSIGFETVGYMNTWRKEW